MAEELTVHNEKLNADFSIKIDVEAFRNRQDDSIIECFERDGTCRKFLKNYLTLNGHPVELPKKAKFKKPKSIFDPKTEPIEPVPEEEIPDDVKKEIDPAMLAGGLDPLADEEEKEKKDA
jgi:hypothetical protein